MCMFTESNIMRIGVKKREAHTYQYSPQQHTICIYCAICGSIKCLTTCENELHLHFNI